MMYKHERSGRRGSTLVQLAIVWGILILGIVTLDMAWWIAAIVLAITLPALADFIRDSRAWIEVRPSRIVWSSAIGIGERADIDHVRLDRRFDGGFRITLVHIGGATTRLPPDISPPVNLFQTALENAGIPVQRHPFSVF